MRSRMNSIGVMALFMLATASLLGTPALAKTPGGQPTRIVTGAGPTLHNPTPDGRCSTGQRRIVKDGRAICAQCDQAAGYYPMTLNGKLRCLRLQMSPTMYTPKGYQPTYQQPGQDGTCAQGAKLVVHKGAQRCVTCKQGYTWHAYYGQGRCIRCNGPDKLGDMGGGKVSCLRCPPGALLSPPHPQLGYRCTCPGGTVYAQTPGGFKCMDPQKH